MHALTTLIRSDLYRYTGNTLITSFIRAIILNPGFQYSTALRICSATHQRRYMFPIHVLFRILLRHYMIKYGIQIPCKTQIGLGFYIGHFGGIVVNHNAIIGNNCNIAQGVTIGVSNRGPQKGCPTIGDRVWIGAGAKVIGNITIGNDVLIGPNCVVIDDVPPKSVVVGVPGRIVSYKGVTGYINRIWPPRKESST